MSSSYIKLIFGIGLWKRGLPRPSHGLPWYSTTSECGPLPFGEDTFNKRKKKKSSNYCSSTCFVSTGPPRPGRTRPEGQHQSKQQEGRPLACRKACKALPQGYRGKWVFSMQVDAEMAYLPHASFFAWLVSGALGSTGASCAFWNLLSLWDILEKSPGFLVKYFFLFFFPCAKYLPGGNAMVCCFFFWGFLAACFFTIPFVFGLFFGWVAVVCGVPLQFCAHQGLTWFFSVFCVFCGLLCASYPG